MVRLLTAAAFCFCLGSVVLAQDAVPGEILQRTKLIKGPIEEGTAFSIDYLGKLYLVTARHVVAGLPIGKAVLQVWLSDKWEDMKIVKTSFPLPQTLTLPYWKRSNELHSRSQSLSQGKMKE